MIVGFTAQQRSPSRVPSAYTGLIWATLYHCCCLVLSHTYRARDALNSCNSEPTPSAPLHCHYKHDAIAAPTSRDHLRNSARYDDVARQHTAPLSTRTARATSRATRAYYLTLHRAADAASAGVKARRLDAVARTDLAANGHGAGRS